MTDEPRHELGIPTPDSSSRILRVPLPVGLIRQIDDLITRGVGGFEDRAELVREAVEAMVLELTYRVEAEKPPKHGQPKSRELPPVAFDTAPHSPQTRASPNRWEVTGLAVDEAGERIDDGIATVAQNPLFGLHNRDFPSLWAASRLAAMTQLDLAAFDEFRDQVTAEAWDLGSELAGLEKNSPIKSTALFPTNRSKPESSTSVFQEFALGGYRVDGQRLVAFGPLFAWGVCDLKLAGDVVLVGVTPAGHALLRDLAGMTAEMPHDSKHAERFLSFVRSHSRGDWGGFEVVLQSIDGPIRRTDLVDSFLRRWPSWTRSVASTNVAGYIARCREWGLVEAKQVGGTYSLTDLGRAQRELARA